MKNKKNKKVIVTVIAIAIILVMAVGASYAYFVAYLDLADTSNVAINPAALDSVAGGSTNCDLNITAADMAVTNGTVQGTPITLGGVYFGSMLQGLNISSMSMINDLLTTSNAVSIRTDGSAQTYDYNQ